jgi:membrane-bound inhibitor of C-type lysozyme
VVSVVGRSTKLRIQWTKTTVKMNNLISTFHFRLHNSTAHLSNVLALSRTLVIKWSLLCWKYKIHKFFFWPKHKNHESTILPTTETTIIGTQRMKVISQYLFRIYIYWGSVIITSNVVSSNVAKYLSYLSCYCHWKWVSDCCLTPTRNLSDI